jgi:AcrR family transcriptional regulator
MEGPELRILEAAIAVIEEFGFKNVTIRRIAAKAGVNIAAINYYFRTKELLMDKVLDMTIENALDWGELAHTENLPPREMLLAVMDHLSQGAQNYPETTRAYFFEPMVNGNNDTRAVREINSFMDALCRKLIHNGCRMNEKDLRRSVAQIFMAGYFYAGVTPNVFGVFLGLDLTKDSERRKFLNQMVDRLIDV